MGDADIDLPIGGVSPDHTLLVSGPPMTGKYELMLRLLARYADSAIVVSTKNDASAVVEDYRSIADDAPAERIGVVDCVTRDESGEVEETETVKYATSPSNLTGIGVGFTELAGTFHERFGDAQIGVGLHSISHLLMHSEVKQVYQFLQVLTGQIRSAEWFGVAVVDASVADEETIRMLHHHFDGVVETRENDAGQRELRVRGLAPTSTAWAGF